LCLDAHRPPEALAMHAALPTVPLSAHLVNFARQKVLDLRKILQEACNSSNQVLARAAVLRRRFAVGAYKTHVCQCPA